MVPIACSQNTASIMHFSVLSATTNATRVPGNNMKQTMLTRAKQHTRDESSDQVKQSNKLVSTICNKFIFPSIISTHTVNIDWNSISRSRTGHRPLIIYTSNLPIHSSFTLCCIHIAHTFHAFSNFSLGFPMFFSMDFLIFFRFF